MEALEQYAQALSAYTAVIDDAARKLRPAGRAAYRSALADAAPAALPTGLAGAEDAAFAESAFSLLARLDRVRTALDAGAAAALDPALQEEAVGRMSRTFVEETGSKAARLREARAQAAKASHAAAAAVAGGWALRLAGGSPEEVSAAYFEKAETVSGAALYSAALKAWILRGVDVAAYVERAKNSALGVPPDSPAAIQRALEARAGLHPVQAMGVAFGLTPENGEARRRAAVSIDMTLPQARAAVRYDLAPLVDAQAAARFGPLASANSGLSYRLAERLQTIREEPLAGRRPEAAPPAILAAQADSAGAVVRTIDRAATLQELRPPAGFSAEDFQFVGAGPRPRVERLGELLEAAVYGEEAARCAGAEGGVRTFADPEKLVQDYDAKVDGLPSNFTLDELGQVLAARFAEDYEAAPPTTADGLLSAITGQRGSRDVYRTYIARAIAEVSKRGSDRQLMRQEASGGSRAALFGSRVLAARGERQEVLISQMADLGASIGAVRQKLLQAFNRIGGTAKALALYQEAPAERGKASVAAAAARQAQVFGLYRAVVDEAFYSGRRPARKRAAKAVEKGQTVEPRLSLKLYVLEHGGGADALLRR